MYSLDFSKNSRVRHLGHAKYQEAWMHFERTIDEYICYIIINGDLYIQEEEQKFHLQQGDVLFLHPNRFHQGYLEASCDYYYIHFQHPGMMSPPSMGVNNNLTSDYLTSDIYRGDRHINTIAKLPKVISMKHHSHFVSMTQILDKAIDNYYRRDIGYHQTCDCAMDHILLHIIRFLHQGKGLKDKNHTAIQVIIDCIHSNYHENINSGLFESLTGYHPDYLNRIFKAHTGQTIHQYLMDVRITHSKELLRTTELTISSIASSVGFHDPFYYSRVFKKATNMSPSQFREK